MGKAGVVFTSARSAKPPYFLPILASRLPRRHCHMTGIFKYTTGSGSSDSLFWCFFFFFKLELNEVEVERKQKLQRLERTHVGFSRADTLHYMNPTSSCRKNIFPVDALFWNVKKTVICNDTLLVAVHIICNNNKSQLHLLYWPKNIDQYIFFYKIVIFCNTIIINV